MQEFQPMRCNRPSLLAIQQRPPARSMARSVHDLDGRGCTLMTIYLDGPSTQVESRDIPTVHHARYTFNNGPSLSLVLRCSTCKRWRRRRDFRSVDRIKRVDRLDFCRGRRSRSKG